MSGLLSGKVWHSALNADLKPLAATLADIGDDDGSSIYPSVAFVAWRLGRSESAVREGLSRLREMKVLVVVQQGGGRHRPTEYRLDQDALPKRDKWISKPSGYRSVSNIPKTSCVEEKPSGLPRETLRPTVPNPSLEPSDDPSSDSSISNEQEQKKEETCSRCGAVGRHVCGGIQSFPKKGRKRNRFAKLMPFRTTEESAGIIREKSASMMRIESDLQMAELYKGLRKEFRRFAGRSLGNLGGIVGDRWVEAYEKMGPEKLERAFHIWIEAEKDFVKKLDWPIARFLKTVDGWAAEAEAETSKTPENSDPNAGMHATDKGKALLERYAK